MSDTILKKIQIKHIPTADMLLMLHGISATHIILSIEMITGMFANFNRLSRYE